MKALEKLVDANSKNKFICVGLDTDLKKLPEAVLSESNPILVFNKRIIEATKEFAAAYKLNFAFYEAEGFDGIKTLEKTLELIPDHILTIGDAKRGDIGNTSEMYAKSIFKIFGFDSITLNPYMGYDSVKPFLEYDNKMNFILALTSNSGADDFEKLKLIDGNYLYQKVIGSVKKWNEKNNCGIVFGATKIDDLKENMKLIGDLPVLLPGVGAQGGSLEEVVLTFKSVKRENYLVNISRGILYKDSSAKFDITARKEIEYLNLSVKNILS
jgi:orotidine-5'-phosphate decarboxylase